MKANTDICYPCPTCGFFMFEAAAGSGKLCAICGWEDDHVQLANPRLQGGTNRKCLVEAQLDVLSKYPMEVKEVMGYRRDPKWRPITDEESEVKSNEPKNKHGIFQSSWIRSAKLLLARINTI